MPHWLPILSRCWDQRDFEVGCPVVWHDGTAKAVVTAVDTNGGIDICSRAGAVTGSFRNRTLWHTGMAHPELMLAQKLEFLPDLEESLGLTCARNALARRLGQVTNHGVLVLRFPRLDTPETIAVYVNTGDTRKNVFHLPLGVPQDAATLVAACLEVVKEDRERVAETSVNA